MDSEKKSQNEARMTREQLKQNLSSKRRGKEHLKEEHALQGRPKTRSTRSSQYQSKGSSLSISFTLIFVVVSLLFLPFAPTFLALFHFSINALLLLHLTQRLPFKAKLGKEDFCDTNIAASAPEQNASTVETDSGKEATNHPRNSSSSKIRYTHEEDEGDTNNCDKHLWEEESQTDTKRRKNETK
jgi:hypothetical protein